MYIVLQLLIGFLPYLHATQAGIKQLEKKRNPLFCQKNKKLRWIKNTIKLQ